MARSVFVLGLALLVLPAILAQSTSRLRVEYLENPLTIDVKTPRFSWALQHTSRGQTQSAYQIIVNILQPTGGKGPTVWDTGKVASSTSLNVPYGGVPLADDSDYAWTVTWWDNNGAQAPAAAGQFSTGLYIPGSWLGAQWLTADNSSAATSSANVFRSEFNLPAVPVRARLYISGLGYHRTSINGVRVSLFELGQFTTFQKRTLYDVIDVKSALQQGCNTLGVMLGHGWFAQTTIKAGPRQLRALLSVTFADGNTTYFKSSSVSGQKNSLVFSGTSGPVVADDIYIGETYDGRIAAALAGWNTCAFTPSSDWLSAIVPYENPTAFGSVISTHAVQIVTDRTYSVAPYGITQPFPGIFVFDFAQNMAGQTEIKVSDCPAGTLITLHHAEILFNNGTVHNNYGGVLMRQQYYCSGLGVETYRTHFSYYGFRYVQVEGFPGNNPGEDAVTAFFIHSEFPQSGEFSSSSQLLNSIQHATRYASWSNLMDIPTDCPQRERRGWLGDAQLSFETVIHNIDGGAFYTKWLNDFADTQVYDNITMNSDGALPDCIPFYGHGHTESDPGWGIAAWTITDWFSDYYADDVFDKAWYPNMKWYMDHWVKIANKNQGLFNVFWWGDWANYVPGPYAFKIPEYPQFFYITALEITAKFATRLGFSSDATYYTGLAQSARALYQKTWYNAATGCYGAVAAGMAEPCTYVSQIMALTLGLVPAGSAQEAAVWAHAMDWWGPNATKGIPEHFGGGIVSLKLALPLLDKFGETGLALKMHLQTDEAPGFGYWIETGGATTLWEQYNMDNINGGASRNHIMFGAAGSWYYSTLAGLDRAPNSRSWSDLVIAPPAAADILSQLSYASASIDTPMGLAAAAWEAPNQNGICGLVAEKEDLTLTCVDGVFSSVSFASFGTPEGSCNKGFTKGACHANASEHVVATQCVGKSKCVIEATNDAFGGDPCFNVSKKLAVILLGSCSQHVYTLSTTVPVGGKAAVHVPTMKGARTVTIAEGGSPVWTNGAYVPGVSGISGGQASPDGLFVTFAVGSGSFDFTVTI